jgi:hypothetical protein
MLSVTYKSFMLSAIMLSVVVLVSIIMLNIVIILNVIMLSVVMLTIVAPLDPLIPTTAPQGFWRANILSGFTHLSGLGTQPFGAHSRNLSLPDLFYRSASIE